MNEMIRSGGNPSSKLAQQLSDKLSQEIDAAHYDIGEIIPIPSHSDSMTRFQTLQEILEDMTESREPGVIEYLIQIRPKAPNETQEKTESTDEPESEKIHLSSGKLNVNYLLKNAEILTEAGETALARNIYKSLASAGEQTGFCHFKLGQCFEREGKTDEAKFYYVESLAFSPTLECSEALISLLIAQGLDLEAAQSIDRALLLKDLSARTQFDLHKAAGNCWLRSAQGIAAVEGANKNCERHFNQALQIDPAADDVRSNLGVLCLHENRLSEAIRHFQDATASNPKNYQALAGLGSARMRSGDLNAAYEAFCSSLDIEVNNPPALFNLVKVSYELKKFTKVAHFVENFIQRTPISPSLLYTLAGLQYHDGRSLDAHKTARKVLELQPDHQGAIELLKTLDQFGNVTK
ncbi:MAG: tetratricopeptide repeat protein [Bdellovibrio sp.]|nr:tetratricopeptide repeat protein [Bdellovibrio sp.]